MLREKTGATPGISQKTENTETETQENQFYPVCETDKEAYEYMRTSHMRNLQ